MLYPGDRFDIHHIVGRRDMVSLDQFWDEDNLLFVCRECHRLETRRENRAGSEALLAAVGEYDKLLGL